MSQPNWLKPLGTVVAVLLAGLLIAGVLSVPLRSMRAPEGYDQPRIHWNTKNTTRFPGDDAAEIAALVSRAVYPATETGAGLRPDLAILYAPADWQGGLSAASLLRPLNAVLLPAAPGVDAELERLQPGGSAVLDGAQVLLLNEATAPEGEWSVQAIDSAQVAGLLDAAGAPPRHALLADAEEPQTALLAAPWLAYSGDLLIFDAADVPHGLPLYALGVDADIEVNGGVSVSVPRIAEATPAQTAVAFARYEDPQNPLFGWGMNADSLTGYRAYTLARPDDPAVALLSANLARRGKPGPLLWTGERALPQATNDYLWSQRAAFWVTPSEGPFHHVWVLGGLDAISFPAQSQADYALEIGPYRTKGAGAASMDMLAAAWVALGLASAAWIAVHEVRFLPHQQWAMRLAWPLLALVLGPFGTLLYALAYHRPVVRRGKMTLWVRPLWLQALVATAGSVGFGGPLMVATGYLLTLFGLPLLPASGPLFWLGAPMVLSMIASYVVAVLVSWPLYQAPMLSMLHGRSYRAGLLPALPVVLVSMASVSLAMFPGMWWLMMWNLPMMPSEESILWFGVMFFTVFMGFLIAWPINYILVRGQVKSGLM